MNCSTNSILLSTTIAANKKSVYGFEVTELASLDELIRVMNTKAVSSGLYLNGHRHQNFLKACGNVYFIDIDVAPVANEVPYYKTIEQKLKDKNVSFVSVPSQSANAYPYKRHIAIILNGCLPTSTKAFKLASLFILDYLCIDISKIDEAVANDVTRQLAPANINHNFTNIDEMSNYYESEPLSLPSEYKAKYTTQNEHSSDISTNSMITFADGTTVSIYDAKKLVSAGSNKSCYCVNPTHDDTNPSATFYHNVNGTVKLFCGKCGNIKISTHFIPTTPTVAHQNYNYSIVIKKDDTSPTNDLLAKIGKYTYETQQSLIWHFKVNSMSDIYMLLLAKCYLVDNCFEVSTVMPSKVAQILLNVDVLKPLTVNQTLPTVFIKATSKLTPLQVRYMQMKQYIQRSGYLFVEASIFATFQNIINPNRDFITTCNLGLAYFEHILKVQQEQQGLMQKDKLFPMKLQGKAKVKANQKRTEKSTKTKHSNMTSKQKQVMKLLKNPNYLKSNGKPNITLIANKLNMHRSTVHEYIKKVSNK
ncbi:hypothetical protein [Sulfurimonas sp. ST-27]|uniref:hypothetical protein n=1 Tax=Sulfurimonas sp. ST-27 TaxID=3400152 RepID=UPI003AB5A1A3